MEDKFGFSSASKFDELSGSYRNTKKYIVALVKLDK